MPNNPARHTRLCDTAARWAVLTACSALAVGCDGATGPVDGPVSLQAVSPVELAGPVGTVLTPAPAVRLTGPEGVPIRGATVRFTVQGGDAVVDDAVRTDGNGVATASLLLGTGVMTTYVTASWEALKVYFTVTQVAGPIAQLRPFEAVPDGTGRVGIAGMEVANPPRVLASDRYGNPIGGAEVTFTVLAGEGTLESGVATTNDAGVARPARWILGGTTGRNILMAAHPATDPVLFELMAVEPGGLPDVVYERERIEPSWTSWPSWSGMVFSADGTFTVTAGPTSSSASPELTGRGIYAVHDSVVVLRYTDDFMELLLDVGIMPAAYNSSLEEAGAMTNGRIQLERRACDLWVLGGCWDTVWIYRTVNP
jgi:hypothetical protein